MRIVFIILLYLVTYCYVYSQWLPAIEKDSIYVALHKNYSENHSYKAECMINAPLSKVLEFLLDVERYPEWMNYCSQSDLLKKGENTFVFYTYYDMPWPLANRDAVSVLTINRSDPENIKAKRIPLLPDTLLTNHTLRVNNYHEEYELKYISKDRTQLKMEGSYSPGGYFPDWVIRKFLTWGPYDVLINIRKLTE